MEETKKESSFEDELVALINRYCVENVSNTPDFILAEYVQNALNAFNHAVKLREVWYDVYCEPGRIDWTIKNRNRSIVKLCDYFLGS